LIYPVKDGRLYSSERLTPNLISYKNGLKYTVKQLQDLFNLLQITNAFASIIGQYSVVEAFRVALEGFRIPRGMGKGGGKGAGATESVGGGAGEGEEPGVSVRVPGGEEEGSGDSVWVQLKDSRRVREYKRSEVPRGAKEGEVVRTPDGEGTVISHAELPESSSKHLGHDPVSRARLISNPKHHLAAGSPEPPNVAKLYEDSIQDATGVRWAEDENGVIHRFSRPSNGETHWNGSTAGPKPIRESDIPIEIRNRLNDRRVRGRK
jgi:hypothetical protein